MKARFKQVYFTKKNIQSLIKSTLQKINSSTNPLERNIQTISLKVNPQIKFEKKINQVQELIQVST